MQYAKLQAQTKAVGKGAFNVQPCESIVSHPRPCAPAHPTLVHHTGLQSTQHWGDMLGQSRGASGAIDTKATWTSAAFHNSHVTDR